MAIKSIQVIINGATHTLDYNPDTGNYEKTITAPQNSSYNANGEHYFPITLKAEDDAGNVTTVNDSDNTFGSKLKLRVRETVAPVITINSPTEGARTSNGTPRIEWSVTDNDSGVNPDTIGITINSGGKITSGITKTPIVDGYSCYYDIPDSLNDGNNTISIDAADYDGNDAVQRTVNFVVDTVPPELSVTSPVNDLITKDRTVTLMGTSSDTTSAPVKVTVKVNEEPEQEVVISDIGGFTTELTLNEGVNTIVVTATDGAGKSASVTRTVVVDSGAPEITSITITPNPVETGRAITIVVTATD